jgi:hypothetical protein
MQENQTPAQALLEILRRADRLAATAMKGEVPDYEEAEDLSGACGELVALIEDQCQPDDEATPALLAVAKAIHSNDAIQIVWESLNGVMHDLSVGHIVDANETVADMIDLLERAGANPETTEE